MSYDEMSPTEAAYGAWSCREVGESLWANQRNSDPVNQVKEPEENEMEQTL
jgi:hypothetical protein